MAKSKLTPQLREEFCKALENGASILGACGHVGITEPTYYNWIHKAEEAKTRNKYVKFKECVDTAKDKALFNFEQVIVSASMEHWQAAAWMLERRYPHMYAKKEHHQVDMETNQKIQLKGKLTTEQVLIDNEDTIKEFIERTTNENDK